MKHRFMTAAILLALCGPAMADDRGDHRGERFAKRLDKDGDGLISRDEFQLPPNRMMEDADTNGDGAVTLDELKAERDKMQARHAEMMAKRRADGDARMDAMFKAMDTDGNGAVTPEEAKSAMFARMDKNGDGYLSRDEMRAARRHHGMGGPGMHRGKGMGDGGPAMGDDDMDDDGPVE